MKKEFKLISRNMLPIDSAQTVLLEKISHDYDCEYGMTLSWTMTTAMTSSRSDQRKPSN